MSVFVCKGHFWWRQIWRHLQLPMLRCWAKFSNGLVRWRIRTILAKNYEAASKFVKFLVEKSTYLQSRVSWHSRQCHHRCSHNQLTNLSFRLPYKCMNRKLLTHSTLSTHQSPCLQNLKVWWRCSNKADQKDATTIIKSHHIISYHIISYHRLFIVRLLQNVHKCITLSQQ